MPDQPHKTIADPAAADALLKTGNGYYYGTTKVNSWWLRYTGKGWLSRGNADLVVDINGVNFLRKLDKQWYSIPRSAITKISTGRRYAGKWTGAQIIKGGWIKDDQQLVSGFSVAYAKGYPYFSGSWHLAAYVCRKDMEFVL